MKLGAPLKAIRHDVDTVEERDAIRDSLGTHKEEISIVERAWNYARRVAKINKGVDYTPQDLQEMREKDYELLKSVLATPTEWDNGERQTGGFSELARQLTNRSGTEHQTVTVREQTRIVFLSPSFLKKIEDGEILYSYGRAASRLYKNPELMVQVENEVLAGKFKRKEDADNRVTEYQSELDRKVEEKAKAIREAQEAIVEPEVPVFTPPSEAPSSTAPEADLPPPEIPDDLVSDKAKDAAAKPPTPTKTDREKAENALKAVESKIEKAVKAGINVNDFTTRLETAKDLLNSSQKESWDQAKELKKELDASINEAKKSEEIKKIEREAKEKAEKDAERKLEEDRKKLAEEAKKELEIEKDKLKNDPTFIRDIKSGLNPPIPQPTKPTSSENNTQTEEAAPLKFVTFGMENDLFFTLTDYMKKKQILMDESIVLLLKKGLEAEGYEF